MEDYTTRTCVAIEIFAGHWRHLGRVRPVASLRDDLDARQRRGVADARKVRASVCHEDARHLVEQRAQLKVPRHHRRHLQHRIGVELRSEGREGRAGGGGHRRALPVLTRRRARERRADCRHIPHLGTHRRLVPRAVLAHDRGDHGGGAVGRVGLARVLEEVSSGGAHPQRVGVGAGEREAHAGHEREAVGAQGDYCLLVHARCLDGIALQYLTDRKCNNLTESSPVRIGY